MFPFLLLTIYCALIVAASFFGGLLPTRFKLTHVQLQLVMSFVGGLILGVSILHMMPHALAQHGDLNQLSIAMLAGVLAMFFLMRVFDIHHHDQVVSPKPSGLDETQRANSSSNQDPSRHSEQHGHVGDHNAGRHHDCDHAHGGGGHGHVGHTSLKANWFGMTFGFAIHTAIDGVALASSVLMASTGHEHFQLYGFGIFLAILLHKPLDAMSITWAIDAGGWSRKWLLLTNFAFSLMCPLGAVAFFLSFRQDGEGVNEWVAISMAFAAGVFLCISLSDILPEVSFHSHDRFKLSMALILGIGLAYGISIFEPEHSHQMRSEQLEEQWQKGLEDSESSFLPQEEETFSLEASRLGDSVD